METTTAFSGSITVAEETEVERAGEPHLYFRPAAPVDTTVLEADIKYSTILLSTYCDLSDLVTLEATRRRGREGHVH